MSADALIVAENVGKAWQKAATPAQRFGAFLRILIGGDCQRESTLEGVDLRVVRGESLGIIGSNGAGKSTLLKLLAGVLSPTTGSIKRCGSIGALLELGTGFELERTGRENLYIYAALHGISRRAIGEKIEEILAFADIGKYIDEPIKHYSSGMVVRLAFALVASTKPDLLITDEVLAVGDESFQRKCIRWIEQYLADGGTLLLVSHSTYHIQKLCKHALWLKDGRVHAYGDVYEVTQDYLAYHEQLSNPSAMKNDALAHPGEYRVVDVVVNGQSSERVVLEVPSVRCIVHMQSPDMRVPKLGWGVIRADGTAVYGAVSDMAGADPQRIGDQFEYLLDIDLSSLLPGQYTLRFHAMDPEGLRVFDTVERFLTIRGSSRELGLIRLPHRWGQVERSPT